VCLATNQAWLAPSATPVVMPHKKHRLLLPCNNKGSGIAAIFKGYNQDSFGFLL
jgi:hypothetical protein